MSSTHSTTEIINPLEPTVFHQPWWLDIASEGRYEMVEYHDGYSTVGRLPYITKVNKIGLKIIAPPPITHFLGPAIDDGFGKANTRFLKRYRITQELLKKLPPASKYYFKCHPGVDDVLGFQACGYETSIQFTHEIHPQSEQQLWTSFRTKARNMIRSARRCHGLEFGKDPEEFIHFYDQNVNLRGRENNRNLSICTKLIEACLERDQGRIYQARDDHGRIAAAMFCAWDSKTSYYLLTSRTPWSHSGATPFIVGNAILDAMSRNLVFDFDGVISEGGIRFANNFTADIKPRYIAYKESKAFSLYSKIMAKSAHHEKFRTNPF